MNPFAQSQYDQIKVLMKKLSGDLKEYDRRLERAEREREEMVKEYWKISYELNTLRQTVKHMPALKEENEILREKNAQSLKLAHDILNYAKTLSGVIER